MKELSIVIVNYNTTDLISSCIKSIKLNTELKNFEIIVVDNNSEDRRIETVAKEYQDVRFIFLDKNYGFGKGCNIGVQHSEAEYVLFLNPDIEVKDYSIKILLDYIKIQNNVAVCSGILVDENNNVLYSYNNFPGLLWEFREAFGIFLKSKIKKLTSRKEIKEKIPFEVDWFHGACILVKKVIFLKVGGFDENIFLYYEDVDLQKKIKSLGYKIICIPSASFFHLERGSVREGEAYKLYYYYMHINKLYYYKKYGMNFKIIIIRFMYILGSIIKIFSLIFRPNLWKVFSKRLQQYKIIISIYLNRKIRIDGQNS